jgi:hypothetical protein
MKQVCAVSVEFDINSTPDSVVGLGRAKLHPAAMPRRETPMRLFYVDLSIITRERL